MIINWWPSISVFLQAVQESLSSTTARKCETVPPGSEMSSGYIVRLLTQKVINLLFLISNMCSFMRRNQARQSHGSPTTKVCSVLWRANPQETLQPASAHRPLIPRMGLPVQDTQAAAPEHTAEELRKSNTPENTWEQKYGPYSSSCRIS